MNETGPVHSTDVERLWKTPASRASFGLPAALHSLFRRCIRAKRGVPPWLFGGFPRFHKPYFYYEHREF